MREPIFKGATRPPMLWGVPLLAVVGVFMPAVVATVWITIGLLRLVGRWGFLAGLLGAVAIGVAYFVLRRISSRDDHRISQWVIALRLNHRVSNRGLFGCRTYSPYRHRGARSDWCR